MTKSQKEFQVTPASDNEAIKHLKQSIVSGKHWYLALLEAIGLWVSAEETNNDSVNRYLISGEAFDWLLLAERLCETVDSLLPENEKNALLFHGKPPLLLPPEEFKELIGSKKYYQYLNFFYGVTVEEAIILAVQEEVRKERRISGYHKELDCEGEIYQRIYGTKKAFLLKSFRHEKGYPLLRSSGLGELKEFAYWLFKYRLKHCDKAKVASDTKKGLEYLKRQQQAGKRFYGTLETNALPVE